MSALRTERYFLKAGSRIMYGWRDRLRGRQGDRTGLAPAVLTTAPSLPHPLIRQFCKKPTLDFSHSGAHDDLVIF